MSVVVAAVAAVVEVAVVVVTVVVVDIQILFNYYKLLYRLVLHRRHQIRVTIQVVPPAAVTWVVFF